MVAGGLLEPTSEGGADAPAAVRGQHAASPRPAPISSANATRASPSYTPIVMVAKSKPGPLPVGLEVRLLDVDAADVVLLLGGGDGEDGVEVVGGVRRGGQAGGKLHARIESGPPARTSIARNEQRPARAGRAVAFRRLYGRAD